MKVKILIKIKYFQRVWWRHDIETLSANSVNQKFGINHYLNPDYPFPGESFFFISRHVSFLFQDIQTTAIPVNASIPEPKKGAAEAINTPESDKGSATQAMKTGGVRDGSTDRDIYTYVAIGVGLALFLATTILVATTCWKYRAGRLSTLNGIH